MHNRPHTEEAKAKMRAARLGRPAPWKHRETSEADGQITYRCGRCEGFFPASGFYRNARTLLGLKSECKACHTRTSILSRNPDTVRSNNAAYMRRVRVADPERVRARERVRVRPIDEKVLARRLLNGAVRRGLVRRPEACEACGRTGRVTGHHEDYTRPLQVRWLCNGCHGKQHRKVTT